MNKQVLTGEIATINGEISLIANPVIVKYAEDIRDVLTFVSNAMDAMEVMGRLNGAEKKAYVLDKAKGIVLGGPVVWEKWYSIISRFIDTIKAMFNLAKKLFD